MDAELSHTRFDEWCEETTQMVETTCHRSCEGCTWKCPGPHYPAKVVLSTYAPNALLDREET